MCFQHILGTKVSQAAAAPVKGVVAREVCHEAPEVFYSRVMLIPVEQVDRPLEHLLRRIERVTPLPLVVKEGVDIDTNPQLVLDGGDDGDLDGVVELVKPILPEEVAVVSRSVRILTIVDWWGACRGHRIPKTSIVGVLDVDYRLLLGEEDGELLVCPPDEW